MHFVRTFADLHGIEAIAGPVDVKFSIANIQTSVVYITLQMGALNICFNPALFRYDQFYIRTILHIVALEFTHHPSRKVGSMTAVTVIFIVIAILMFVFGGSNSHSCDQCYCRTCHDCIFPIMVLVSIGVVACLDDEFSPAITIYPNSPLIIIPCLALYAVGPGVLLH